MEHPLNMFVSAITYITAAINSRPLAFRPYGFVCLGFCLFTLRYIESIKQQKIYLVTEKLQIYKRLSLDFRFLRRSLYLLWIFFPLICLIMRYENVNTQVCRHKQTNKRTNKQTNRKKTAFCFATVSISHA